MFVDFKLNPLVAVASTEHFRVCSPQVAVIAPGILPTVPVVRARPHRLRFCVLLDRRPLCRVLFAAKAAVTLEPFHHIVATMRFSPAATLLTLVATALLSSSESTPACGGMPPLAIGQRWTCEIVGAFRVANAWLRDTALGTLLLRTTHHRSLVVALTLQSLCFLDLQATTTCLSQTAPTTCCWSLQALAAARQ